MIRLSSGGFWKRRCTSAADGSEDAPGCPRTIAIASADRTMRITWRSSEIERVDVRLRDQQRRAEHDLAAAYVERAEPAGHERRRRRLERPLRKPRRGLDREIPEIPRVPQHDRLDDAAVHVRLVQVRRRQADDRNMHAAGLAPRTP